MMATEIVVEEPPVWFQDSLYGNDSIHVGKYDTLWVWQNKNGRRWSAHLNKWVTQKSGEWTSFLEALLVNPNDPCDGYQIDEYTDHLSTHGPLPEGGKLININEP